MLEETNQTLEEPVKTSEEVSEESKEKLSRKERRREKIKQRMLNLKDIKYQGPLSYRYLRIIAWVFLVLGQVAFLNSISTKMFSTNFLGETGQYVFQVFPSLTTPLFIIASFGIILSGHKSFKNVIAVYGAAFLAIGAGLCLFYGRYIDGLFTRLGIDQSAIDSLGSNLGGYVDINVFADLFAFVMFHFFINYMPHRTKIFEGKRIIIFRLLSLIPVIYIIASYIFKILDGLNIYAFPFYAYPFLTTKSPLVFMIFASISLWIKNREKIYVSFGATRQEYRQFLKTNRNSLSFSLQLSLLIVLFSIIDFVVFLILFLALIISGAGDADYIIKMITLLGGGQCFALQLTIPFILLYSYTRTHKNTMIDIFIPVIGIGLIAFVYIEGVYQLITILLG